MPVYFIQAGDNGPVKIGFSRKDATERMEQLQAYHYEKLFLRRVMPGLHLTERSVHQRFASLRLRGEWFTWSEEMLAEDLALPPTLAGRPKRSGTRRTQPKLPHVTFDVMEDGGPYCRGLVISLADL